MRISDVLRGKGPKVVTIRPDAPVRDLLQLLDSANIGAVVVSEDGATITGIVSERDIVRHLADPSRLLDQPVSTIMTSQVHTCAPHATVDSLMRLMTEQRIRHVPVVVDGRLAGLVSIGDVVKTRIGELEFEREQLENYIAQA
ncbi:CBS domain-containing protein [Actinopolymorpha rutila]|uniref:CBS domain-containing protein n=1 Tax=Actinopolymorpha rutila TaxID=446787 RepID=A0A852ZIN9_9ACTN|nr:CBS domain-containing protein [Actinopolymorpha rutila]NYH88980.1 CBS domain-containing protein [Actinopolymorpha rutila]